MFGRPSRADYEEQLLTRRRALTDRIMEARDKERIAIAKARGNLDAGDYSAAATECHRAHQAKLVGDKLLEVLDG